MRNLKTKSKIHKGIIRLIPLVVIYLLSLCACSMSTYEKQVEIDGEIVTVIYHDNETIGVSDDFIVGIKQK